MTLVPFVPKAGINSDDTTFLKEGTWADGNNVRFRLGMPEVIGGWSRIGSFTLSGTPTNALTIQGGTATIYATTTKLYVFKASTLYDITPSGFTSATSWSLAEWGSYVLAAPKNQKLYVWANDTGVAATHVTQAPAQITSMIVTPERQVLALGCNEETSGTFNGRCVRGSDLEDYTDWTTATNNNAFEHIIETTGTIAAGRMIGPYVGVWTYTGLHLGEFIGDPGQTYRFDRVGTHAELFNDRSIVIQGLNAFWVTIDGYFRTYTVGGTVQDVPCPIFEDWLKNQASSVVFGIYNSKFEEVWWFYGDARDANGASNATRYVAMSLREGVWFRGQMERSAGESEHGNIMVAPDGKVYRHEQSNTELGDGGAINWHIQTAGHYFDESRKAVMLRRFVPDFEQQAASVDLTLYVRDNPRATAVTKGPYAIATDAEKVDFRATGNIIEAKFSGTQSGVRFGKPMFDVAILGEHGQR